MKKKAKCVQCHKPMLQQYGNENWSAPFCEAPDCPNYGVLQAVFQDKLTINKNI